MLTRLSIDSALLPTYAALRRLLRAEPVAEVTFVAGQVGPRAAVAVRTLLPFPRPIRATATRGLVPHDGPQTAFLAALFSAPVMASATELVLTGVNSGWATVPLVSWLAKSPFLGDVQSLSLANNRLTCAGACHLARVPNLRNVRHLDVTNNPLLAEEGKAALAERFGEGLVI